MDDHTKTDLTPLSDLLAAATSGEWEEKHGRVYVGDDYIFDGLCDARLVVVLRNLATDLLKTIKGAQLEHVEENLADNWPCGCHFCTALVALQRKARVLGVEVK